MRQEKQGAGEAQEMAGADGEGIEDGKLDENSVQNTVFHFRLEVSDFGAVFGLEWPGMGLGERLAGEETPPGTSGNCGRDGNTFLHDNTYYIMK